MKSGENRVNLVDIGLDQGELDSGGEAKFLGLDGERLS
jgi:hypothetical protein